ncbi:aminotransferase class III-fold pyridoxal phosphate-dependent enzyme [Xanthobacter sp. 126]|uniref:aminotransferase class III-fold pyridoxal phosphate-dependent enzyme n=1 Tax=Xanthobacter sp. 126 TaxID=1131814 RepID=UPI0004B90226|nr:aminotransferase class III-fold pyridoxal phosphate-dependent enzyme [Xanthobacter sp. 126]
MSVTAPDASGVEAPFDGAAAVAAPALDFSGAVLFDPARIIEGEVGEGEGAPASARCAALLTDHSFGDVARFFADRATAWRGAVEAIRLHHRTAGRPKRREIIVVSDDPRLPPVLAQDAGVRRIPEDEAAIEAAMGANVAALLLAPASIDAGLRFLPGFLLAAARQAADEYGVVLMFDETDAGLGRTGMAFAHEWRGVAPDVMVIDGLPGEAEDGEGASALVLSARLARSLPASLLLLGEDAAAGLLPVLAAAFVPGFETRVQEIGWKLEDRLATLRWHRPDLFTDTTGTGLVQGLVCAGPAASLTEALAERGLFARPLGNVLAMLPPLTVTEAEISAAGDIIDAVVAAIPPA